MHEVIKLIEEWQKEKATGNITVNFFKGGISSWKIEKTFKPDKLEQVDDKEGKRKVC